MIGADHRQMLCKIGTTDWPLFAEVVFHVRRNFIKLAACDNAILSSLLSVAANTASEILPISLRKCCSGAPLSASTQMILTPFSAEQCQPIPRGHRMSFFQLMS